MDNVGGGPVLDAIDVRGCSAVSSTACRHVAPAAPNLIVSGAVDAATNTIYAGGENPSDVEVLNGATCHAGDVAGCKPVAGIPEADPLDIVAPVDTAAHTLYVVDGQTDTVSLVDTATCNAIDTAGCHATQPKIVFGGFCVRRAVLDESTNSLYILDSSTSSSPTNPDGDSEHRDLQRRGHRWLRPARPAWPRSRATSSRSR